jgi:spermidine/putrescine transport system ATP-binding protein
MSFLELEGVGLSYGPVRVLRDISLAVGEGEFLTLLGPSGSGKSTILRLIGGFLKPDRGRVRLRGQDLTALPANRRPFNTVFQDYALFPHMTVLENVSYGPRVQGRLDAAMRRLVGEVIGTVGLTGFEARRPAALSGGQRQRVALARAIVCRPQIILLDEPLSALDAEMRHQMQDFLKDLQRRLGITFIFVTHDQTEAIVLSDRVVVLDHGRIEQVGTPRDVYYRPASPFVAGFFGDNNLLPGTVAALPGDAAEVETALGLLRCGGAGASSVRPGERVLVAIRPESLRADAAGRAAAIERIVFVGAMSRIDLRTEGGAVLRWQTMTAGGPALAVGDTVRIGWDEAAAVVVPQS